MPDVAAEPTENHDGGAGQGFSCPGIGFLPGLLVILNVHLMSLLAGMYLVSTRGLSWSAVAITTVPATGFWVLFLLTACVIGVRGAINMVGFVSAILFWLGVLIGAVVGLVWLVWWLLSPAS